MAVKRFISACMLSISAWNETPLIYVMRSLPTPGYSVPIMGPLKTIGR
jgi:hypothetical protein